MGGSFVSLSPLLKTQKYLLSGYIKVKRVNNVLNKMWGCYISLSVFWNFLNDWTVRAIPLTTPLPHLNDAHSHTSGGERACWSPLSLCPSTSLLPVQSTVQTHFPTFLCSSEGIRPHQNSIAMFGLPCRADGKPQESSVFPLCVYVCVCVCVCNFWGLLYGNSSWQQQT